MDYDPRGYPVVHVSRLGRVLRALCGGDGPCAVQWRYCSCLRCLEHATKDDPRIEDLRTELLGRETKRR
jgi:hypothetical protein